MGEAKRRHGDPRVMDASRAKMTASLRRLVSARTEATIEHMAVALAQGRVDLNSRDQPIIYLATMFADRELDFRHVHEAVSRAFEIRRDEIGRHPAADAPDPLPPLPTAPGATLPEIGRNEPADSADDDFDREPSALSLSLMGAPRNARSGAPAAGDAPTVPLPVAFPFGSHGAQPGAEAAFPSHQPASAQSDREEVA